MFEFKLPDVGEGMHEAEILQWLVQEGDAVALDQPMLEIQTDKAVVEIPAPVAGTIAQIRAKPGAMARVGDVLVVIAPAGEGTPPPGDGTRRAQAPAPLAAGIAGPGQRVLAAPAVRKLALELGLDLAQVPGSGPVGRVLPSDVRRFAEQPPPAPPPASPSPAPPTGAAGEEPVEEIPLQGLRRRIAERMEEAWRVPHVTSFEEVDASNLTALRQTLKPEAERRGVKLSFLPLIAKATVQALQEFPNFNATLDMPNRKILLRRYYHLGIAAATADGLIVPVLRHANRLNVLEIAAELGRLADLARRRKLAPEELTGSTFTITNVGSFGGWLGTPIINPPEAAILGCGRIEDRPVALNGQLAVRPVLPLMLSYDHRLIDGAAAGQFLARLKSLLANPAFLLLELR